MQNDQLGFEFLPDLPVPAPAPPKRAARAPKASPAAKAAPPAPLHDPQAMACALEAHPDYRIQRRLQPRLQWPAATASQALAEVVILDTETTGLDASRDAILELALLRMQVDRATGLPVGTLQVYDGLQDPGRPIPAEITAITGITDADVRGQRLDEARIAELLQGVDLVIAHNAGFDRPFAEARLPRFMQLAWACSFADIDWKAQGRSSAKLESLAHELGWFYDAHRAEMDCHALLAVLASPLPQEPRTGLARLLEAGQQPSYRISATHAPFEAKDTLKARGYRWNAEQRVWQIRVLDDAALQAECQWLRSAVYGARAASVQLESMDALCRYSTRAGAVSQRSL